MTVDAVTTAVCLLSFYAFSALTLLVGWRGIQCVKRAEELACRCWLFDLTGTMHALELRLLLSPSPSSPADNLVPTYPD